jgi:hypothetical protein
MPSQTLKEVKLYMTPNMHKMVLDECALCDCKVNAFVRYCLLTELTKRAKDRAKAAKCLPLPGQRSIDGIAD